ncbi:MAG: arginine--tRNA ligase, partial [Hadesarchaea archaeon]|nr:arginine--tRNA ligase [Hadesarchaea archaeon]
DHMLGLLYVEIHRRFEQEPGLQERVREILSQLERGDGKIAWLARRLSERCVRANLETTDRLNISYDLLVWESDLARSGMLKEVLDKLRETPYLVEGSDKYKGTLVLRLKDFGIEDKVLVRSDGTAVYTARDIAYQLWKFGLVKTKLNFKFHSRRPDGTETHTTSQDGKPSRKFGKGNIVINVIGAEQKFPQQVVFSALKALGFEREYQNSHHLAYEHVWLPTGKFSGRKGTWVGYSVDEVLEEAVQRAYLEVKKRNPNAGERFRRRVAEIVGVGAVRYSLIQTSPEKKVVFRWEDALNFEQNSAPAIQYSHARACSILRKAGKKSGKFSCDEFKLPEEHRLIKLLAKLPEVLLLSGKKMQPSLLALYAAELALEFNKFYEVAPVIDAPTPQLRAARLELVDCVRIVLENVLNILGIEAPERM